MQLHEAAKLRDWESVQKMFLEAAKELASELKIPRGQSVFHTGGLKESHGMGGTRGEEGNRNNGDLPSSRAENRRFRWPCVAN